MKNKPIISGIIAATLAFLCGCHTTEPASPQKTLHEQVTSHLNPGGSYYQYSELTATLASLYAYGDRVSQAILQSDLPPADREKLAGLLNTVMLGISLAGLDGEVAAGSSSVPLNLLPDSPVRYRNVSYAGYGPGMGQGLLWQFFGTKNRDLRDHLRAIPADALFVADFEFYPERFLEFFERIAANFAKEGRPTLTIPDSVREFFPAMGGEWFVLLRPVPPEKQNGGMPISFLIGMPDHGNKIFRKLTHFEETPEAGTTRKLSQLGAVLPFTPVLMAGENSLCLYSDEQAIPAFKEGIPVLADTEQFAALTSGLKMEGTGFFYSSAGLGNLLTTLTPEICNGIAIPVELPNQLYIMRKESNGLLVEGNSGWDLNTTQFGLSLTPMLLQLSLEMFNSAEDQQDDAQETADFQECGNRMQQLQKGLAAYADAHDGRFPAGNDIEGFRELIAAGNIPPDAALCPAARGDQPAKDAQSFDYDNCSYVYFGGATRQSPPYLPLVVDWPFNHQDRFHVLFVNGEIRSYPLENLSSCRRLVSFLHSEFKYTESEFLKLLQTADKLDAKFIIQ